MTCSSVSSKSFANGCAAVLPPSAGSPAFPEFPTLEMAEEAGLSVNRSAFDALMAKQRSMAKADAILCRLQIDVLHLIEPEELRESTGRR